MSWLERLNDRNTRRLARDLGSRARSVGNLAQDHLAQFAAEAGGIAAGAAQQAADYGRERGAEIARDTLAPYMRRAGKLAADVADYGRNDGADIARDTVRRYAHRAGELASEAIDYGRQEGTLLAQAAAVQALRAGRAVKADPVPIIVGAVGVALFANLLFGRRRD
ncbi:MAG: hypothetical protein ACTHNL_02600 [Devosia sp.]